jgi:hypothetical protein
VLKKRKKRKTDLKTLIQISFSFFSFFKHTYFNLFYGTGRDIPHNIWMKEIAGIDRGEQIRDALSQIELK